MLFSSYTHCMSQRPDIYELARMIAVLQEYMITHESASDRLEARIGKRDVEMARFVAGMAKHHRNDIRWHIGMCVALVVIVGPVGRWPG